MKILLTPESKFIEDITPEQLKVVKIRITGMILATDMASHAGHVEALKSKLASKHITKERRNGHLLIEAQSETDVFKN